jgi:hypothetical protein
MGPDERDRAKRSDEPDVEAHKAKAAADDRPKAPEDKPSDDAPDVEAHIHKR